MGKKAKTKSTHKQEQEPAMTNEIETKLGGINQNLININQKLDRLPCTSNDPKINPQERISALETNQDGMKKRMGIVEKLAGGLVLVFGAIAAWFKASGGDTP